MSGARVDTLDLGYALALASDVARRAGALLREGRARGFTIEHKGAVDLVTEYDRRSEELVVGELGRAFPEHAVLGEEGHAVAGADGATAVWYVDPLDGTTNYAHGVPFYAVSIALELAGLPTLGVVLAPELGWEFTARRDHGATLNGRPLHVSTTATLDQALLATGFPYDRRTAAENNVRQFAAVLRHAQGIRRMGAAALDCALVAAGMLDGYWEYKVQPWDIAAGALLVLEAGGQVTDTDGGPYRATGGRLLATNGLVHDELRAVLDATGPTPLG